MISRMKNKFGEWGEDPLLTQKFGTVIGILVGALLAYLIVEEEEMEDEDEEDE